MCTTLVIERKLLLAKGFRGLRFVVVIPKQLIVYGSGFRV